MADDPRVELELRDFLRVFRRRKAIIAATVAFVVAAALVGSFLQTPVYAAKSRVLLQPRSTESLFDPNTGQRSDPARAAKTEIEVLRSEPVRTAVRKELGRTPSVSAATVNQTDVIEVTAKSTNARRAVAVANAYARAYIDFRRQQAVDDVLAAAQQVQSKIDGLQKQIDGLDAQVAKAPPPQQGGLRDSLNPQKNTLITQQGLLKQKLDQLQVDAPLTTGGAQFMSSASLPSSPISPRPLRAALLAVAIGLFLGTGVAFLVEYLDDSIKTNDDLARIAPSIPVIGLIPAVSGWKSADEPKVVSLTAPQSQAAEAYRALRTSVNFLSLESPVRTLQITSPSAQEGKTTTLANLGVALARAEARVVIVCCDLRRPRIHEFFGLSNAVGFTSVLLGKVPLSAALQPVADQPRLSILASGPLPPNPSELLSSKRLGQVFTSLVAEADIVLVDTPPVLPVTDALVLSGRVDATLLVAVAGATTRKDVARAVELLSQVDAPLVGTVLNGVTAGSGYRYDYGYYRPGTNGDGAQRSERVAKRDDPSPPPRRAESREGGVGRGRWR